VKIRSSLYAKMLLWLVLNLLLIVGLFLALPGRSGMGWNVLLSEPVRDRLLTVGERVGRDLSLTPEAGWDQVLASYAAEYGVSFALDQPGPPGGPSHGGAADAPDGPGAPPPPPPSDSGGPPRGAFGSGPPPDAPTPPANGDGPGSHGPPPFADRRMRGDLIAISHPRSFDGYELRIPAQLERSGQPARPLLLQVRAPGLHELLGFLGVTEWLLFAVLVITLSALLWWPFIWGITRTVVRVTAATHDIAAGRFETRVGTRRNDELGRLADSVNRMAERLQSYVSGQKQFLADVAHEVTSPLARMQMGLGILESRLGEDAQHSLHDVQEEAQQMSRLLNELLLFSRAGMEAERGPLAAVELRPLLLQALQHEDPRQRLRADIVAGVRAMARPDLLQRAVANLVRNALRYAGDAPVELSVARGGQAIHILVRDRGPGVPEAALARLGEPFYRPEVSRDRDSGGTGLGLAIVKRCVEACGGGVVFRNREGGGFEAEIWLEAAD